MPQLTIITSDELNLIKNQLMELSRNISGGRRKKFTTKLKDLIHASIEAINTHAQLAFRLAGDARALEIRSIFNMIIKLHSLFEEKAFSERDIDNFPLTYFQETFDDLIRASLINKLTLNEIRQYRIIDKYINSTDFKTRSQIAHYFRHIESTIHFALILANYDSVQLSTIGALITATEARINAGKPPLTTQEISEFNVPLDMRIYSLIEKYAEIFKANEYRRSTTGYSPHKQKQETVPGSDIEIRMMGLDQPLPALLVEAINAIFPIESINPNITVSQKCSNVYYSSLNNRPSTNAVTTSTNSRSSNHLPMNENLTILLQPIEKTENSSIFPNNEFESTKKQENEPLVEKKQEESEDEKLARLKKIIDAKTQYEALPEEYQQILLKNRSIICPLSQEIMFEPVVLLDEPHNTVNAAFITEWYGRSDKHPFTNKLAPTKRYGVNLHVRDLVEAEIDKVFQQYLVEMGTSINNNNGITSDTTVSKNSLTKNSKNELSVSVQSNKNEPEEITTSSQPSSSQSRPSSINVVINLIDLGIFNNASDQSELTVAPGMRLPHLDPKDNNMLNRHGNKR